MNEEELRAENERLKERVWSLVLELNQVHDALARSNLRLENVQARCKKLEYRISKGASA